MKTRLVKQPSSAPASAASDVSVRAGLGEEAIAAALADNLHYQQAVPARYATRHDWYVALALAVRDRLLDRYLTMIDGLVESRAKVVARSMSRSTTTRCSVPKSRRAWPTAAPAPPAPTSVTVSVAASGNPSANPVAKPGASVL